MISSKILVPCIIGIACLLALLAGVNLAMDAEQTMTYVGVFVLTFALMAFAREYWWFALFLAIGFGGYVYFGFKIYAHELLLAIALGGLLPSIALNPYSDFAHSRPKLPRIFYLLGAYLVFQIIYSLSFNNPRGLIENGNIARAYMNGIWPLLFLFFFRFYGRTDHLPVALYLLQGLYLVRALMTLSTMFFPASMMLPGINFVLPGNSMNAGGLDDLRFSGHGICMVGCALLLGRPRLPAKLLQYFLLIFAFFALMMSGGRLMLVASILLVIAALFVARQWKVLVATALAVTIAVSFFNIFPDSINGLPSRMQRALSILVIDSQSTGAYYHVVGSNFWHDELSRIGFERWTDSVRTFLIGTGIRPWDATIARISSWDEMFKAMMEGAADTGNYESGLWAILAPTGLIGFLLYVGVLGYFAFQNGKLLFRRQLQGIDLTIAFLGTYPALEWLIFSFRAGGYPAIELLLACTAFYYLRDRARVRDVPTEAQREEASIYSDA